MIGGLVWWLLCRLVKAHEVTDADIDAVLEVIREEGARLSIRPSGDTRP